MLPPMTEEAICLCIEVAHSSCVAQLDRAVDVLEVASQSPIEQANPNLVNTPIEEFDFHLTSVKPLATRPS